MGRLITSAPCGHIELSVLNHPPTEPRPPGAEIELSMPDELIVEFQGVSKSYGSNTAIRDISFQVDNKPGRGEFVSLLGPSGCGKSTILRLIAGLRPQFPATTGTVKVMGKPVDGPGADRGIAVFKITRPSTIARCWTTLPSAWNALVYRGKSAKRGLANGSPKSVSTPRTTPKNFPARLSGGMQQRVAIARTASLILSHQHPF